MSDNYNQGQGAYPTQPASYYPGGQPPGGPRQSNLKWYLTIGGLLLIILALLAVAFDVLPFSSDDEAAEATYVVVEQPPAAPVFEEAGSEGTDPFFPINLQLAGFEQEMGEPASPEAVVSGLFGGTAENTCDPQRLIDFLLQNPRKGLAWATVQGIRFEEIPAYINSLTVRVLAEPTTVLNHGFSERTGAAYEIESTLAAGTAVLVDNQGDVRTRCYCGNPIKPKPVGHRPPRCLLLAQSVFIEPRSTTGRPGATNDVVYTGRTTSDLEWTQVAWGGRSETETGWTPTANIQLGYCVPEVVLPPPATAPPFPTPLVTPSPFPTVTPGPTTSPVPTPRPTTPPPAPQPTTPPPAPQPTTPPTPVPSATPTVVTTPTATPTRVPTPLRLSCSISNIRPSVGETIQISGSSTPNDPAVVLSIDHGDGTIDPNNPSFAVYLAPGDYQVRLLSNFNGLMQELFCGTVTVSGGDGTSCQNVQVIGLSESSANSVAAANGCTTRVVHRDGVDIPGTTDFRFDRINLWIGDGIVFDSSVG